MFLLVARLLLSHSWHGGMLLTVAFSVTMWSLGQAAFSINPRQAPPPILPHTPCFPQGALKCFKTLRTTTVVKSRPPLSPSWRHVLWTFTACALIPLHLQDAECLPAMLIGGGGRWSTTPGCKAGKRKAAPSGEITCRPSAPHSLAYFFLTTDTCSSMMSKTQCGHSEGKQGKMNGNKRTN